MKPILCMLGKHKMRLLNKATAKAQGTKGLSFTMVEFRTTVRLVECGRCGKREGWVETPYGTQKISACYLESLMLEATI